MIDKKAFTAEMAILRDRFGRREMLPETLARYYDHLSQHLTTEQFLTATREIFNTAKFWPAPTEFTDIIHGNPKQNAERAWQEVLQLAQAGNSDLSTLPPATREAIKAAGGWRAIAYAESEFQLSQARRAFHNAITTTPALPAAPQLEAHTIEVLG